MNPATEILTLLDASNARANAATGEVWKDTHTGAILNEYRQSVPVTFHDSAFIAAARTELPRANEAIRVLMNCADHCATNPLYTREDCAEHAKRALARTLAILKGE